MTDQTKLMEQIRVVAEARQKAKEAQRGVEAARTDWEQQNKSLLDIASDKTVRLAIAEAELRQMTLDIYHQTQNKAPCDGVGIRERIVLSYDAKIALDWAKSHKIALMLDKKAFEKIAQSTTIDFVKVTTEPQATIATDLDKVLEEAEGK